MASVPGSFLVFNAPTGDTRPIHLSVTPDGTGATTVAGSFNIEVFTQTPGAVGANFDASAFIQGAVQNLPTEVRAGSIISIESMISGAYQLTDVTGGESIQGGNAANQSIIGASGDTISGGNASGFVVNAMTGKQTVIQGTGASAAIFGGVGDVILASASPAPTTASAQLIGTLGQMSIALNSAGNYTVASGTGDTITGAGSSANSVIIGATGDLINLTGNTGNAVITGATGGDTIVASGGNNSIGVNTGDSVVGAGQAQIMSLSGPATIVAGASGTEVIASASLFSKTGGNTINALAGNSNLTIVAATKDSINLTGNTGAVSIDLTVNTTATNAAVTVGSGSSTVYGGAGDTLTGGTGGTEQLVASLPGATGMSIIIGSGGGETVASGGGNKFSALSGNATVQISAGAGDVINLTGNTGPEAITSAAGTKITVGSGLAQVNGAAGTTSVMLNSTGNASLTGAAIGTAGTGDSISGGGSGSVNFLLGFPGVGAINTGRDYIDLSKTSGANQLNLFNNPTTQPSAVVQYTTVNDTVLTGTGSDSVFAGPGDSIGVGTSTSAGGTHLWDHSTSIAGAVIKFGTDDSVAASSTANVSVTNFQTGTDLLFYQNESTATNNSIVASSTPVTVAGQPSVLLHLPDGTSMTLVGVTQSAINTANIAGKLFG